MEEKLKSVIYLEGVVKQQEREIKTLKQSLVESDAQSSAKNVIIESLEKINERLLMSIECKES